MEKILRVNLADKKTSIEPLCEDDLKSMHDTHIEAPNMAREIGVKAPMLRLDTFKKTMKSPPVNMTYES
jgi:hypothetical protein